MYQRIKTSKIEQFTLRLGISLFLSYLSTYSLILFDNGYYTYYMSLILIIFSLTIFFILAPKIIYLFYLLLKYFLTKFDIGSLSLPIVNRGLLYPLILLGISSLFLIFTGFYLNYHDLITPNYLGDFIGKALDIKSKVLLPTILISILIICLYLFVSLNKINNNRKRVKLLILVLITVILTVGITFFVTKFISYIY